MAIDLSLIQSIGKYCYKVNCSVVIGGGDPFLYEQQDSNTARQQDSNSKKLELGSSPFSLWQQNKKMWKYEKFKMWK